MDHKDILLARKTSFAEWKISRGNLCLNKIIIREIYDDELNFHSLHPIRVLKNARYDFYIILVFFIIKNEIYGCECVERSHHDDWSWLIDDREMLKRKYHQ